VGATARPGDATRADSLAAFEAEGCSAPRFWGNGPDENYGRHEHDFHKVLFCLNGSIVFHIDDGAIELRTGDRLDIEPATSHSATVGPEGCECVEATR
jgi:mannose-6-phosphate isomerase-like protein (cupin superfamily)